jgi:tetratricopeptide (TPR) repeat protein
MSELYDILEKHAEALGKKGINVRSIVLIDPTDTSPTGPALAVWLHDEKKKLMMSPDALAKAMGEYIKATKTFLENIILKGEDNTPRTMYTSTKTRRMFLRIIKIPIGKIYGAHQIIDYKPERDNPILKHHVYYLGVSIAKQLERIDDTEKERPQAIFDEIDLLVEDLRPKLGITKTALGHTLIDIEKYYINRYRIARVIPLLDKLTKCYPEDEELLGVLNWVKELVNQLDTETAKKVFSDFADLRNEENTAETKVMNRGNAKKKRDDLRKSNVRWRQILTEEKKFAQL